MILIDIKAKLQIKGITEVMMIDFDVIKNKINQIVSKLKTEVKYQTLFCRVMNAEENMKDI